MTRRNRSIAKIWWVFLALAVCLGTFGAWSSRRSRIDLDRYRSYVESHGWFRVRKANLETVILAGGELMSRKESTVTCQVEDLSDSEGTVILSIIDNGTSVKKGDELCRLDASAFEEMASEEEIKVHQAKSTWEQAKLTVETARLALSEFRDGLVTARTKEYEGRIALAKSDIQRMGDRRAWTERMLKKGYASLAQVLSERQTLAKAEHELEMAQGELDVFRRFEMKSQLNLLQSEILIAEQNERLEHSRYLAEEVRLNHLRQQIDRCVVRAPQDGVAVLIRRGRRGFLQPGDRVYETQPIFRLPDLQQMEVELSVNESVGPRVKVGMRADVRIASLGERVIPGKVVSITQLSDMNWKEWDERIRQFTVRVALDETPPRMLPLLSATAEIKTGKIKDALIVPATAIDSKDYKKYCFVAGPQGLERRLVETREGNHQYLEVVSGLHEGDLVITPPDQEIAKEFTAEATSRTG